MGNLRIINNTSIPLQEVPFTRMNEVWRVPPNKQIHGNKNILDPHICAL